MDDMSDRAVKLNVTIDGKKIISLNLKLLTLKPVVRFCANFVVKWMNRTILVHL